MHECVYAFDLLYFRSGLMFVLAVNFRRLALAAASLFAFSVAQANTLTVVNANATGAGSLAQAVSDANANPGADVIHFNIPGAGPFLISGMPDLSLTDAV